MAGAKASLQIDCRHNYDEGNLTVQVDGKTVLHEPLVNKKSLTVVRPVGVGQHKVTVHVVSEKAKFDQQQDISGEFAAGGSRVLVIDFGRLSGMGFRERKLALKWGS